MKYAVISDIHGNSPALQLALADAQKQGAEGYLLLGDYCISAPWANEVIAMLRALPNAYIISGNDEAHLDVPDGDDGQYEVSRWCAAQISPDDKAWLDALPQELCIADGGMPIRMAHSSEAFVGKTLHARYRTSRLPYLYPSGTVSHAQLTADFRAFAQEDVDFHATVMALPPGIYLYGHNHIQLWADIEGRILINPGSCGLPLDAGEFCAAYTLLEIRDGRVTVTERRLPYDVEALIHQVKASGQYTAARIWSEIIFSEWRTRREKVYEFLMDCEALANQRGDDRRPFARDTWEAAFERWEQCARQCHPELFVT